MTLFVEMGDEKTELMKAKLKEITPKWSSWCDQYGLLPAENRHVSKKYQTYLAKEPSVIG